MIRLSITGLNHKVPVIYVTTFIASLANLNGFYLSHMIEAAT